MPVIIIVPSRANSRAPHTIPVFSRGSLFIRSSRVRLGPCLVLSPGHQKVCQTAGKPTGTLIQSYPRSSDPNPSEAHPKASTANSRGKCLWDALTVSIKNIASERLPQRSTCHAPCNKPRKGTRHVELCSRRSVLITYHRINVFPHRTGARRNDRAKF